ncbi:MAG TPA: pitrilysin family protein [Gemmatimonadaceae bacterium]|nr:pitrilysin family protein [Gemmatimonadaceae bacterium]
MRIAILPCRRLALAAVAVIVAVHPAAAQRPAAASTLVTSVEGITEHRLSNGLRVLLFPDESKPTVTVNITYLVGSRHEGYGETGMAHLLEHMLFKGSTKHRNIPQELTEHGSRPNGTTWYDRTNYFETVPATEVNLLWALDLEADRMVNSFVAKKDLESEFSVVRNEFELGENDPDRILDERVMATAYLWHGYGRSTIGSKEDIESVPVDRLQSFYRRYYQPDNAVLVVAGKFDAGRTLQEIERRFGAIPKPVRSLDKGNLLYKTYTVEPVQDGERFVALRRVGDAPLVTAAYHVPAGSDSDFPAVDVLTLVLGNRPSGRLYTALVDTKIAANVFASTYQLKEPGVLIVTAQLRNGGPIDSARAVLERTLDGMQTSPITDEEVARAKTTLLKDLDLLLQNSERVGFALTEWAAKGDWRLLFLYRDKLETVKAADVQRVAAAYLKPSNRTVGVFYPTPKPDRSTVPPLASVEQMVAGYKGRAVVQAGEAFDASPSNIDARTKRSQLPGGMYVTLVPKRTRGSVVQALITLRYGDSVSLTNKTTAARLTGAMLSRGTLALTRQQVRDSLDKLKARVNVGGGGNTATASIETTREKLPAVLSLVASELRTPRLEAAEFDKLKQEMLAQLEAGKSEPQTLALTTLQRRMNPYPKGHPLYTQTPEEQIAEIGAATIEQVRQFHKDFYGAAAGDLTIVGDVSADSVSAQARALFGDWKAPITFSRLVRSSPPVDSATIVTEAPDKANAWTIAATNVALRDDDPDYPALAIADFILGGGMMNSRLMTRLRQQEGLSYGAGSQLSIQALDRAGIFLAYAIYNPQNVDKVTTGIREELQKALSTGFSAKEIEAAKPSLLQQRMQSRASDQELVGILTSRRFANRTMAYDTKFEAAVNALTPEQVNAAVRKYLDPAKLSLARAGDFKGKPAVRAAP